MRKTLVEKELPSESPSWFDLDRIARVEVTSEDAAFDIESAFLPDSARGWRAAVPGEQKIRLLFDSPQWIRRIELVFVEERVERIQEFVLRWRAESASSYQDVVRQQFVFSPGGATCERENYTVNLHAVVAVELQIIPDLGRHEAYASVQSFRIG